MGSGLGASGDCFGTWFSSTRYPCESLGSAAKFSMWLQSCFSCFSACGVIALARPWSWLVSSDQDIQDPVVKVRIGIVSGIALIAIISFGWPALLIVGIAFIIFAAAASDGKKAPIVEPKLSELGANK